MTSDLPSGTTYEQIYFTINTATVKLFYHDVI